MPGCHGCIARLQIAWLSRSLSSLCGRNFPRSALRQASKAQRRPPAQPPAQPSLLIDASLSQVTTKTNKGVFCGSYLTVNDTPQSKDVPRPWTDSLLLIVLMAWHLSITLSLIRYGQAQASRYPPASKTPKDSIKE